MRWFIVFLCALHGLIHAMGFVKAFGLADLPQLTQPIGRGLGVLWLLIMLVLVAAAVGLAASARWWWAIGAVGIVLSQAAIVTAWADAKAGTAANLILLVAVVYGFLVNGPGSFRAQYDARAAIELAAPPLGGIVTEADVVALPAPVARYIRLSGAVGRPRVDNFRARFRGEIRGGAAEAWMPYTVEQVSRLGPSPSRLFFMNATMRHLPVVAFHAFVDGAATMRVKVAGAVTVVDAKGPEMTRAETVTLFNDLCVLAPGGLVDPAIRWEAIDDRATRGHFTHGAWSVSATLVFNDAGELIDFVSDDRLRSSADGTSFLSQRWSTPLREYRTFGAARLGTRGEGRWHAPAPEGTFAYLTYELLEIEYNVRER